MKKSFIIAVLSIIAFSFSVQAQNTNYASSRLSDKANQLKRHTVDLVDRTYSDLKRGYSNSRREIDAAFLAQQFDASAGLFEQMVRDNRPATELRDAASVLNDLSRRAPNYGSNSNLWRDANNAVNDIERELGNSGNNRGYNGNNDNSDRDRNRDRNKAGRAYWRGTVDKRVQLVIRDQTIETLTLGGRTYSDGTYNFTAPLPNRNVDVEVERKSGRGDVRVLQQPNRRNDYTAIIEIEDKDSGAKQYQVEISW